MAMRTIILLLLLISPVMQAMNAGPSKSPVAEIEKILTVEEKINNRFIEHGVPEPMRKLVITQARLESGRFTNKLSLKGHNIFSMRHPVKRPTTSIGPNLSAEGRKGYAQFESIESAVDDYILYMDYFSVPDTFKTVDSYAVFLKKKGYYECTVKRYIDAMNGQLN